MPLVVGFHPVWRDYPISTGLSGLDPTQVEAVLASFHPVWRDYPISTNGSRHRVERRCTSFHPVWRDYPISTVVEAAVVDKVGRVSIPSGGIILFPPLETAVVPGNEEAQFPSRLAGLSYFHPLEELETLAAEGYVSIPSGGIILFPRGVFPD